jgi:peptide/nickel transport system ATP-binding protein
VSVAAAPAPVLSVHELTVELHTGERIVQDLSLQVDAGEILGLVGESGSGKTTTALAILGYSRPGVRVTGGETRLVGEVVRSGDERAARRLRGRLVSYVPQDPGNALNPSLRIGQSLSDMLDEHAADREVGSVESALSGVHLPATEEFARRYPHQLSGGQQQRVTIALALVCEPPLVVLDEPTTGLDVVTQARVLEEVARLRNERGLAMVYVSHDLAVVAQVADRIAVMYAGRIVEEGPAEAVLSQPRHPYTRGLIASIPDHVIPRRLRGMPGIAAGVGEHPAGCAFAPRCPQKVDRCEAELPPLEEIGDTCLVRCFEWRRTPALQLAERASSRPVGTADALLAVEGLRVEHGGRFATVVAADDVSFEVAAGECVALVGESGSGKTTIARCIAGLHAPAAGRILLDGAVLAGMAKNREREQRRRIQIVFQNPYDSLNPRHRVSDAVARPARVLRELSQEQAMREVAALLERVRLPARVARRFPGELSGGERQRVAIARALAAHPDLLVCDELTSALDVSVQAAVLELLAELRADLGLSLLFISHDLGVVASVADRVLVLDRGVICEQGPVEQLLRSPEHPYTRQLIEAAPRLPDRAPA